jgi:hypothetical protein
MTWTSRRAGKTATAFIMSGYLFHFVLDIRFI